MKKFIKCEQIDMTEMLNQIYSETLEESKIKVQTYLDTIMTGNKHNLRNMVECFYQYGVDDSTNNSVTDEPFLTYYRPEELDSMGGLYLLQYEYYDEISESNRKEIYSNILLTNYNKALETKNKLLQIVEFGKKFVIDNVDKYDDIYMRYVLNKYDTTVEEDEFFEEYLYFYEMSKINDVTIICLNINNNDWQLDQYFDKHLNKFVT